MTADRACLFGHVSAGQVYLNNAGILVDAYWLQIPEHFPFVELDAYVVMPNHIHGVLTITPRRDESTRAGVSAIGARPPFRSPSRTLGSIVRGYKSAVTKWFWANTDVHNVWQRNYHERIIADEHALRRAREYIIANPTRWARGDARRGE